ncbi:uncharacterized protein MELLADRAFT_71716 [Melampsora larici-populina 98AG31]|uniref:Uncharacterized protein n=1 Tax=Melampsora larici-populina (strain 98AG31 / pathotype 3-4-7) TaxID=747676 RepID=F4RJQ3_MELLP|nr:uncharacterized protein MELLADRAFT_71716 [Melampsora larici-populina 98AG31]EGG07351.1 hypothetical protein MELLADRAFT_71716 [Melampsora larici-populina 98AG31]
MASLRSRSKENSQDFHSSPPPNQSAKSEEPSQHWLQLRVFNLPFLPVLASAVLFFTIVLGTCYSYSLYSIDNPNLPIHQLTRIPTSSLVSTHNAHPSVPSSTLPYFAKKSNFFNQTFVKLGWAWTSLAVWAHLILFATHHTSHSKATEESEKRINDSRQSTNGSQTQIQSNHVARSMTLYCTATALWIFLTQWFFGSSLIDRLLVLTGAECVPSMIHPNEGPDKLKIAATKLSNAYCERRWGQRLPGLDSFTIATHRPYWSGGIDISGHAFLLSFSILLILSTLAPSIRLLWSSKPIPTPYRVGVYANLTLVGIWWWMLLMTSLYFHGPAEKAAGLVVGVGAWWISEMTVDKLMG